MPTNRRNRLTRLRSRQEEPESHAGRNVAIALAVVGLLLTLSVASRMQSTLPLSTFTIGNEAWTISTKLYGGKVGSVQQVIPEQITPSAFPTTTVEMTGTVLRIDADRKSTNTVTYQDALYRDYKWNGYDGQSPDVVFQVSQTWAAMPDGSNAPGGQPYVAKEYDDADGVRHWYLYYFKSSVVIKTLSTLTDDPVLSGWADGQRMTPREFKAVDCVLWMGIHLQTSFTGRNFTYTFSDAKVLWVENGYEVSESDLQTLKDNFRTGGSQPDYPWSVQNTHDINHALSPLYPGDGTGSGDIILQLSTTLQPGEVFSRGGWQERSGVMGWVDCYTKYNVLYSLLVSTPIERDWPPRPEQEIDIVKYIQTIITNPEDPMFWVLVAGVLVAVYLLFGRKKKQPAPPPTQPIFIMGGGRMVGGFGEGVKRKE